MVFPPKFTLLKGTLDFKGVSQSDTLFFAFWVEKANRPGKSRQKKKEPDAMIRLLHRIKTILFTT